MQPSAEFILHVVSTGLTHEATLYSHIRPQLPGFHGCVDGVRQAKTVYAEEADDPLREIRLRGDVAKVPHLAAAGVPTDRLVFIVVHAKARVRQVRQAGKAR